MGIDINGKTKVVGIIGYPVEHSFSPAMHNAAFKDKGINYVYVPFPVKPENIALALEGIRGLNLAGVNVTIPHKSAVIGFLDEVAPEAKLIGAVNTIVNDNGILRGYNTDAPGFLKSLELDAGVAPKGKRILVLGAGGAARAVSIQLALSGAARLTFATPVPSEVTGLETTITHSSDAVVKKIAWNINEINQVAAECDIIINATPIGMYPNVDQTPPLSLEILSPKTLVCDLIYNPRKTLLLQKATDLGLHTMNGMGMLLYQGAIAFELWIGSQPPLDIMRVALEENN